MFCKIIEIGGRQVLGRIDSSDEHDYCDIKITVESGDLFATVKLGPFNWDKAEEALETIFNENQARTVLKEIDALTGGN